LFGSAGNSSSARQRAGDGTGPYRSVEGRSDLSTQILNNSEISQKLMGELVPITYKSVIGPSGQFELMEHWDGLDREIPRCQC
jgi:hypothetical protein